MPKSALTVEEKAWNAYPYTRTVYTCPFVEKFSLDIETVYKEDCGNIDNVFKLNSGELRERTVGRCRATVQQMLVLTLMKVTSCIFFSHQDLIDVVKDQLYGNDYVKEEDPTLFVSRKTRRGPLTDTWISDYWQECKVCYLLIFLCDLIIC